MNTTFHPFAMSTRLRALALLGLMLAMLSVQCVGLLHRSLHINMAEAVVAETMSNDAVSTTGLWDHLRSGKVGDGECRLYDQMSLGDIAQLHALPALPTGLTPMQGLQGTVVLSALIAAWFIARAPPLIR